MLRLESGMYFSLRSHLDLDQSHFGYCYSPMWLVAMVSDSKELDYHQAEYSSSF